MPRFLVKPGYALLKRNPQDHDVKFYLARTLISLNDTQRQNQVLQWVESFIKADPRKASYYSMRGGIYFNR